MGCSSQQNVSVGVLGGCAPAPPAQQARCPRCGVPRKLTERVCASCGHSDEAEAGQAALAEIDDAPCKGHHGACTSMNSCWRHYRRFDLAARLAGRRLRAGGAL